MLKASGKEWKVSLFISPVKIISFCRKGHKVMEVLFTMKAIWGSLHQCTGRFFCAHWAADQRAKRSRKIFLRWPHYCRVHLTTLIFSSRNSHLQIILLPHDLDLRVAMVLAMLLPPVWLCWGKRRGQHMFLYRCLSELFLYISCWEWQNSSSCLLLSQRRLKRNILLRLFIRAFSRCCCYS